MDDRLRPSGREAMLVGIDHVQLAAPAGCEAEARRFYTADPWGNRLELIAS